MSAERDEGDRRAAEPADGRGEPIREMVCISCPVGCRLALYLEPPADAAGAVGDVAVGRAAAANGTASAAERLVVTGNRCSRGEVYAREEYLAPKRVVTATVRMHSGHRPRLPVRTSAPLPKGEIEGLLRRIYELELTPPIERGEVIIPDIAGSGVDLLASFSVKE